MSLLQSLKSVEENLFSAKSIQLFLKEHSIHQLLKLLNKTNKQETRDRIKLFFYKIGESEFYNEFLNVGIDTVIDKNTQRKEEFEKYITSDYCQQYFELLDKKIQTVIKKLDADQQLSKILLSLTYTQPFGIKMIKIISKIYAKQPENQNLYSQQMKKQLLNGVSSEDSVVQMRFVEIVANIAILGGESFKFVQKILQQSLNIYETEDILLKLNIVQIISTLGQGDQTSQLLKSHKIWAQVQKDALDTNQQFYIRKCLLILLVNMATLSHYAMTPKFTKNVVQFLGTCLQGSGEQLEAGLELSGQLMRSIQGTKLLVQNSQVFGLFLKQSRSPTDRIKNLFIEDLILLTDNTNGKKTKAMVISILNCIGNPNLSTGVSQSISSNNLVVQGLNLFCKWFSTLLQLPFQDLQIKLIGLFINLLEYSQICEELFEDQGVTKYLLRPVGKGHTTKVLKAQKNKLMITLLEKGSKEWKNTKLETYAVMIQKQLQKDKMQVEYALDAS